MTRAFIAARMAFNSNEESLIWVSHSDTAQLQETTRENRDRGGFLSGLFFLSFLLLDPSPPAAHPSRRAPSDAARLHRRQQNSRLTIISLFAPFAPVQSTSDGGGEF